MPGRGGTGKRRRAIGWICDRGSAESCSLRVESRRRSVVSAVGPGGSARDRTLRARELGRIAIGDGGASDRTLRACGLRRIAVRDSSSRSRALCACCVG